MAAITVDSSTYVLFPDGPSRISMMSGPPVVSPLKQTFSRLFLLQMMFKRIFARICPVGFPSYPVSWACVSSGAGVTGTYTVSSNWSSFSGSASMESGDLPPGCNCPYWWSSVPPGGSLDTSFCCGGVCGRSVTAGWPVPVRAVPVTQANIPSVFE